MDGEKRDSTSILTSAYRVPIEKTACRSPGQRSTLQTSLLFSGEDPIHFRHQRSSDPNTLEARPASNRPATSLDGRVTSSRLDGLARILPQGLGGGATEV